MTKKIDKIFSDMAARQTASNSKRRMFNAWTWFRKNAASLKNVNRKELAKDRGYVKRARPMIGRMYTYFYNPKTKDFLPYYDKFPLVLIIGPAPGGFVGLNMHYLSPKSRAILMDELIKIAAIKSKGKLDRLRLTYELLNGASKLAMFRPCYKRYLNKHLVSPPREIPSDDWEKVLFLPTESFVGSSKSAVWKESLKKI